MTGRAELDTWLRRPPDTTHPPRDELVIKVLVALRLPGVDASELTQVYRRHVVEAMQQYTRLKEDAPEDDIGLLLVADAEIYRLDAIVRWLDAAEARIRRMPPIGRASCDADAPAASCSDRIGPMTAVLEMTGVSKSYGDGAGEVLALHDADLTVHGR